MDCSKCPHNTNITPISYRQAADKIWEMAQEYKKKGEDDLAESLYELSQQIHDLARSKQMMCCSSNNMISE
jgi:hypothetical protein